MDANMEKKIAEILDSVMQEFCCLIGDLALCEHHDVLSEDTCTVCTTFEGGYHAKLVLVADRTLLLRLTQCAMEAEEVAPEDVEDFAKELLNVICGRVWRICSRRRTSPPGLGSPSFASGGPGRPRTERCVNWSSATSAPETRARSWSISCPASRWHPPGKQEDMLWSERKR